MSALHEADKRDIILRINQKYIGEGSQTASDRLLHVGIEVNGVDQVHVAAQRDMAQRLTDLLKARAKILPAVTCDQDHLSPVLPILQAGDLCEAMSVALANVKKSVDPGIPSHVDCLFRNPLPDEVLSGSWGRCEM